jgi:hypothetical protein
MADKILTPRKNEEPFNAQATSTLLERAGGFNLQEALSNLNANASFSLDDVNRLQAKRARAIMAAKALIKTEEYLTLLDFLADSSVRTRIDAGGLPLEQFALHHATHNGRCEMFNFILSLSTSKE